MPADFGAEGKALGGAGGAILAFLLGWSGRARSVAGVGAFGGLLAGGPVLHALALGQALVSCLSTRAWQGIGAAGIGAVGTPVSKAFDFGGGGASNPLVFGAGGAEQLPLDWADWARCSNSIHWVHIERVCGEGSAVGGGWCGHPGLENKTRIRNVEVFHASRRRSNVQPIRGRLR